MEYTPQYIFEKRVVNKISQAALAKKAKKTQTQIHRVEKNTDVSQVMIDSIGKVLDQMILKANGKKKK